MPPYILPLPRIRLGGNIPIMVEPYIDDGRCVFDIYTRGDTVVDIASMNDFHDAAENLVRECVTGRGDFKKGGIATGIGKLCNPSGVSISPQQDSIALE